MFSFLKKFVPFYEKRSLDEYTLIFHFVDDAKELFGQEKFEDAKNLLIKTLPLLDDLKDDEMKAKISKLINFIYTFQTVSDKENKKILKVDSKDIRKAKEHIFKEFRSLESRSLKMLDLILDHGI